MTEDHGASWHGPSNSEPPYYNDDVYFIPDNVFEHMQNTYFTDYYDPCADTTSAINSWWSYYEFDMNIILNKNYITFINILNEIIISPNHFGKLMNKLIHTQTN